MIQGLRPCHFKFQALHWNAQKSPLGDIYAILPQTRGAHSGARPVMIPFVFCAT